ncbi:MAG TPA: excinuclease ABC subunit UvrC [Polyangiaceae bacterium]|nr:excinuclease ABC subunit UvrC [Polyangiaceae bacterium]
MLPETVTQKLQGLAPGPGCYLFKDRHGEVLYVGKAKSLRARVRSYFQDSSGDSRAFIPFLRKSVGDLETIVTATEKEAAILENSLIKEYKPRFNVKLRDDKEYLNLRLSSEHAWPRLELVRRPEADKARYFGPYHSATAARRTLHLVEKHFQLRTCSDRELEMRKRPCLQYQIKRCPAPCVYDVDHAYYAQQVRAVSLFLDGRHDELSAELETRMRDASRKLEFELAAIYRDQLGAVHSVREQQRVVVVSDLDQDVVGLYREGDLVEISALYVRSGRVVEATSFSNPRVEVPDDEVVAAFLREHYGDSGPGDALIPDEILMPMLPEGADGVAEWLTEKRQIALKETKPRARCELIAPVRGSKRKLLDLAIENARHAFLEKRRAAEDIDERLARVQQKLRLPTLPRRIECCDISHLGGMDTVGSVVALENGTPYKKRYRTYNVRGVGEGDDYAAMYQVLARRFRRGKDAQERARTASGVSPADLTTSEETPLPSHAETTLALAVTETPLPDDAGDWELPDLFVVDGGRGQLAIALTAARDLGLHDLCVVGLAKERETAIGDKLVDRVYLPNQKNPIPLRPNSPELFILARARDEAHRFANRGRKKVGKRRRIASELEAIPGVGPKTRKALLTTLGSLQGIREASDEQILAVPGVTKRQLAALRSWFAVTDAMKNAPAEG